MKFRPWLTCLLIAASASVLGNTSVDGIQSGEKQLLERLAQYKSFEAKFAQTVQDKEGKTIDSASGTFVMSQPNRLYWQQEAELEQLVVTDGTTLWLYDPDFEQVTIRTLTPESTAMPSVLFSGNNALIQASFDITQGRGDDNEEHFILTPKGDNPQFKQLGVSFNHNSLSQLTIFDFLGQVTQINVVDPKQLDNVSDSLFTFTPPAGTEIIDDRN